MNRTTNRKKRKIGHAKTKILVGGNVDVYFYVFKPSSIDGTKEDKNNEKEKYALVVRVEKNFKDKYKNDSNFKTYFNTLTKFFVSYKHNQFDKKFYMNTRLIIFNVSYEEVEERIVFVKDKLTESSDEWHAIYEKCHKKVNLHMHNKVDKNWNDIGYLTKLSNERKMTLIKHIKNKRREACVEFVTGYYKKDYQFVLILSSMIAKVFTCIRNKASKKLKLEYFNSIANKYAVFIVNCELFKEFKKICSQVESTINIDPNIYYKANFKFSKEKKSIEIFRSDKKYFNAFKFLGIGKNAKQTSALIHRFIYNNRTFYYTENQLLAETIKKNLSSINICKTKTKNIYVFSVFDIESNRNLNLIKKLILGIKKFSIAISNEIESNPDRGIDIINSLSRKFFYTETPKCYIDDIKFYIYVMFDSITKANTARLRFSELFGIKEIVTINPPDEKHFLKIILSSLEYSKQEEIFNKILSQFVSDYEIISNEEANEIDKKLVIDYKTKVEITIDGNDYIFSNRGKLREFISKYNRDREIYYLNKNNNKILSACLDKLPEYFAPLFKNPYFICTNVIKNVIFCHHQFYGIYVVLRKNLDRLPFVTYPIDSEVTEYLSKDNIGGFLISGGNKSTGRICESPASYVNEFANSVEQENMIRRSRASSVYSIFSVIQNTIRDSGIKIATSFNATIKSFNGESNGTQFYLRLDNIKPGDVILTQYNFEHKNNYTPMPMPESLLDCMTLESHTRGSKDFPSKKDKISCSS